MSNSSKNHGARIQKKSRPGATGMGAVRQLLQTPGRWIPMLVLSVLWLGLSLLSVWGFFPQSVRVLSFLTFAQGGMYGGIWGAVGGVVGKAVFAYFFGALVWPLFVGHNPFRGLGRGVKALFSGFFVKSAVSATQLIVGIGLGLIVFNFLSGNAGKANSVIGIVGFLLALRALSADGSILRKGLSAVIAKFTHGAVPAAQALGRVISGYATGQAIGVALAAWSRIQRPLTAYLPYIAGAVLLLLGLVIGIAAKKRGVATA